jgi:hypothetical protein
VALTLALLGGMVWLMAPARSGLRPAPLRPVPGECPLTTPGFVPSDATEVPGADLAALSKAQRNHILFRVNMEPCSCGCNASIVACRISHPACPVSKSLVDKIVAEEQSAPIRANGR